MKFPARENSHEGLRSDPLAGRDRRRVHACPGPVVHRPIRDVVIGRLGLDPRGELARLAASLRGAEFVVLGPQIRDRGSRSLEPTRLGDGGHLMRTLPRLPAANLAAPGIVAVGRHEVVVGGGDVEADYWPGPRLYLCL